MRDRSTWTSEDRRAGEGRHDGLKSVVIFHDRARRQRIALREALGVLPDHRRNSNTSMQSRTQRRYVPGKLTPN